MEAARNSTFKNPFVSTVQCTEAPSTQSPSSVSLVPGRYIAAASAATGGINIIHSQIVIQILTTVTIKPTNFLFVFLLNAATHQQSHRLMCIRFNKILRSLRTWRCHLLWFYTHHGRAIRFSEMSFTSRCCQI